MTENPLTVYNWLQTGGVLAVLCLGIYALFSKRMYTGSAYADMVALYEKRLVEQKADFEKRLTELRADFEKQIVEIRVGHAERCADYEKRLAKEERTGLEWRNIALRIGNTVAVSASVAETAVALVDRKALTE